MNEKLERKIAALKGGDRSAFDYIYEHTHRAVYFAVFSIVRDRMHAEDILTIGRNTRGVKLMTLKEGVVATVATTQRDEEEEVTAPEETTASDEALVEAGEEGENDEA